MPNKVRCLGTARITTHRIASAGNPIVHIVDGDDSFREALLRFLASAGHEAHGYSSAGEFLLHPPSGPGCVLLDVCLPGPSGIELQAAMCSNGIDLPVVFVTSHGDVSSTVQAMKAGAIDFLQKPVKHEALLGAISRALESDKNLRSARGDSNELHARFERLTSREWHVFVRVLEGKVNKVIAHELAVAERTVKIYRAQMMEKIGARSPAEVGVLAERLRQLSPE